MMSSTGQRDWPLESRFQRNLLVLADIGNPSEHLLLPFGPSIFAIIDIRALGLKTSLTLKKTLVRYILKNNGRRCRKRETLAG